MSTTLKIFYGINMKGNIKIIAAVLVMLFCLSPLSAVDFNQDDANDCNSTNTLDSNASKTIHKNNCGLYIHVHDIYANQTEDIEIKCDPHYKGDIKIQKNHL